MPYVAMRQSAAVLEVLQTQKQCKNVHQILSNGQRHLSCGKATQQWTDSVLSNFRQDIGMLGEKQQ